MPPRVTLLVEVPRDRVRVELDGEPWRTLPAAAVVAAQLTVGTVVDRDQARELARARRRAEALGGATRALARRDRSAAGLTRDLERRGVSGRESADVVAALASAGYVDDGRFAADRAEALARRGYGNDAVRNDLEREGVAPDRAAAAVESLASEAERADAVLRAARSPQAGLRRLAAKGFTAETIEAALADADCDQSD